MKLDVESINAFINTPKGKKIAAVSAAAVVPLVVLVFGFGGMISEFIPGEEKLEAERKNSKRAQIAYADVQKKYAELQELDRQYAGLTAKAWRSDRDGDVETELRKILEKAAQDCEIRLNSIGMVRKKSINNNLSFAELDVNVTENMESVVRFLRLLQENPVGINWKRVDMRNDARWRPNTSASAAPNLNFSGTIRVVVVENVKKTETQASAKK